MEDRLSARPVRGTVAVAALGAVLLIAALWWALALWPLPARTPAWLARTRLICFGSSATGLPDAAGWVMLLGQPAGMLVILVAGWGDDLHAGLAALRRHRSGRLLRAASACCLLLGILLVGWRVREAGGTFDPGTLEVPGTLARIDRPAPPITLVDQRGRTVSLSEFHGRPVLVAFAYAHCETVCPLSVRAARSAQLAAGAAGIVLLVITLDPWRDTPSRLPAIAEAWELGAGAHVLSGTVAEVERVLDAWGLERTRNPETGEIGHPTTVLVVDRGGRIAFAVPGHRASVLAALEQLGDS